MFILLRRRPKGGEGGVRSERTRGRMHGGSFRAGSSRTRESERETFGFTTHKSVARTLLLFPENPHRARECPAIGRFGVSCGQPEEPDSLEATVVM